MKRREAGFTLIELMVVVLIIAILVAIAVPVFSAARESAWRRTCQSNLRTIDGAVQTYYASYDELPTGFIGQVTNSHPLVAGGFLKRAPECPKAKSQNLQTTVYTLTGDIQNPQGITAVCPGNYQGHDY
ncbi:MAG: prepilin-type N-terminal cleavage/methylation domain-containing protein [Actinobacteria bacterium]|nr:prepilin-type N-terminal cleavage/methylation domain-containing protein [Actinomycetota bacterium]